MRLLRDCGLLSFWGESRLGSVNLTVPGTELAEQELSSDPTFPLFVTGSFQQLSMATESAAQIEPEARLAEIFTMDNNQLQWHLMIAVARVLAKNDSK